LEFFRVSTQQVPRPGGRNRRSIQSMSHCTTSSKHPQSLLHLKQPGASIAAEKPGAGRDFRLQAKAGSEGSWVDGGVQGFTPLCVLSVALTANRFTETSVELGGDVGELNSYSAEEVRSGLGLLLVSSVSGLEWISYEAVAQHGSGSATVSAVNRGLFGTRP